MTLDAAFIPLLLTMAAASFLCRASGFWLMRFVPVSPRVQAALNATPLAVMVGIVAPAAARGNIPEIAGLGAVFIAVRLNADDVLAAILGVAVLAGLRAAGL
jgi:branched chain amino acid efflux pump